MSVIHTQQKIIELIIVSTVSIKSIYKTNTQTCITSKFDLNRNSQYIKIKTAKNANGLQNQTVIAINYTKV